MTTLTSTTTSTSTSSCVMATSGALNMMKISDTPMPDAPIPAMAVMRLCVQTVRIAPATIRPSTVHWIGCTPSADRPGTPWNAPLIRYEPPTITTKVANITAI